MIEFVRKNFQRYALLRAAIYIIAGLAIILDPTAVFNFIGYLIAAYFVLSGVLNLLEANKNRKRTGSWGFGLMSGIIFFIAAMLVLAFASAIVSILPILLGAVIVLKSIFQLFVGLNTRSKGWSAYSILLLLGGLILLFNPFKSLMVLFQLFGGLLVFMGGSEIVRLINVRKKYS
ncbi:DUF308 domain-containing protein [Enterococcus ratti]|uniref:HdeD family acid-resistance protein n=1 Tax=Enterococcus ratti TaxID=150033 RepID=UPI003511005D